MPTDPRRLSTGIAVAMHIPLGLLNLIDHVCSLPYVVLFVGRNIFHAISLPVDVFPASHGLLVFSFVRDIHVAWFSDHGHQGRENVERLEVGWLHPF